MPIRKGGRRHGRNGCGINRVRCVVVPFALPTAAEQARLATANGGIAPE